MHSILDIKSAYTLATRRQTNQVNSDANSSYDPDTRIFKQDTTPKVTSLLPHKKNRICCSDRPTSL
ncbi:hypothetical protein [Nostoc sp.]|uniref:hypothetical protein n=1 Tax=Nostoc sp. TaxID=1180 RepID=UPI002FF89D29